MLGVLVVAGGILVFTIVSTRGNASQLDSADTGMSFAAHISRQTYELKSLVMYLKGNLLMAAPELARHRRKPAARLVRSLQDPISSNLSLHPTQ